MALPFRTVTQSKDTIHFGERVNDKAVRDFVPALYDLINRGAKNIALDFRRCERAYAEAVLPIICLLDHRRDRGNSFKALLPDSLSLRQLFLNANWAHYLDPSHPKVDMETKQQLAARRYTTHPEQQLAVNAAVDVVLRSLDLNRDVIRALELAANEITDNVLNHAQSPFGGLVQVSTFREEHRINFVVADAGRGIPAAMRAAFPRLRDEEALSEAIRRGVTSTPEAGQGNGLADTLRIATHADGSFKVTSGRAQLNVFKDARDGKYRTKKTRAPRGFHFTGTAVMMELSTNADFSIAEALSLEAHNLEPPSDVVELKYTDQAGDLVLPVARETLGFGTRHAGAELRRKCHNLLNAEPDKRLILDWACVPLVSSSFADEALGKLFVELGPTTFSSRVTQRGAEPLVRSLLDRAIMQRVAQTMAGRETRQAADS